MDLSKTTKIRALKVKSCRRGFLLYMEVSSTVPFFQVGVG
jgi:hypothetical protein